MTDSPWMAGRSVYIKYFWGWTPETWGAVGFTDAGRRDTLLRETTDPFVMVAAVTLNSSWADRSLRGRIAGLYLVSHVTGDRDEFTHPRHHATSPGSWRHSFKALRAFSFAPRHRLQVSELGREFAAAARSVARYGRRLEAVHIARLAALPIDEVPVYGGTNRT